MKKHQKYKKYKSPIFVNNTSIGDFIYEFEKEKDNNITKKIFF